MIVCDTSALLAAFDAGEPHHRAARAALEADEGPFVVSPFVLAEHDYLVATRLGVDAELTMLRDVVDGAYLLASFEPTDLALAVELVSRYHDLGIGLADASIVVLAARFHTRRILTLDHRQFGVVRPLQGGRFEIVPAA